MTCGVCSDWDRLCSANNIVFVRKQTFWWISATTLLDMSLQWKSLPDEIPPECQTIFINGSIHIVYVILGFIHSILLSGWS